MRIVIDLQGAQTESRFRGIGRYSLSLALAIARNKGEHEIIIALNGLFPDTIEPIRAAFDGLIPQNNIRVWHAPGPVNENEPSNAWRREVSERIREAFIASLQADVVHIMSLFEGYIDEAITSIGTFDTSTKVSVSAYDLIPLLNPDHYLKPSPDYKTHYLRKVEYLTRADLLLTISKFTQQEVSNNINFHDKPIVNVGTAAEKNHKQLTLTDAQAQHTLNKFNISRPFILYTGATDERKNLPRLIHAYNQLSAELRNSHQLVFAGKITEGARYHLQQVAKSSGLNTDELVFTGYVSDNDLAKLYNLCKLYIFPSWHEGFGLPALEAMSCGAPVIGANTTSLPEVIGNPDALFDPYSTNEITSKLSEVLTNDDLREKLSLYGLQQAKNFSWDKSALLAIAAFEKMYKTTAKKNNLLEMDAITTKLIKSIASIKNINKHDNELASIASTISINLPQKQHKQLFLDISELAQRDARTGVQRVTRSILKELLDNPPDGYSVEPVYATTADSSYRYARKFTSRFMQKDALGNDDYIEFQHGDIFLGVDLQHHTTSALAPFLTRLHQQGVKVFFVVYDLLPIQFPNYWPSEPSVHAAHSEWLSVISKYDGAICISHSVADELTDWLKTHGPERQRPFKISWFHLGADVKNSAPSHGLPDDAKTVLNKLNEGTSFLMVGTIEPRKCYEQVFSAFEKLWTDNVNVKLVIVGKQGWLVEELINKIKQHRELGKRLFWLEGISDEYLEKIYDASTCLIAASEGEGFGLPLIEAAQHKLPIIARDIPVFQEVAGEFAYYFDGIEPSSLATAIKKWVTLYQSKQHPRSDAMPWQTWKQSTSQLKDIILNHRKHSDLNHIHK